MSQKRITDIILDYDGTCTQIPLVFEGFLATYYDGFALQMEQLQHPLTKSEWKQALEEVRKHSPRAGWTLNNTPCAPASADPYILAFETACFILRQHKLSGTPAATIFPKAYEENTPPWREEAAMVFTALQEAGIRLHFISNSGTAAIKKRLELLKLKEPVTVEGSAAKYCICEPAWDPRPEQETIASDFRKRFEELPAADDNPLLHTLGRPVYLRRGSYFEAICRSLQNEVSRLSTTVFCGDIWELDLALPAKLGACIHLVKREPPFSTCTYETAMADSYGAKAKISDTLSDLLHWL